MNTSFCERFTLITTLISALLTHKTKADNVEKKITPSPKKSFTIVVAQPAFASMLQVGASSELVVLYQVS